jgi:hypothetical protein
MRLKNSCEAMVVCMNSWSYGLGEVAVLRMALFAIHRLFNAFRDHRELEQSSTARIENRVGDHATHADNGGFSTSLGRGILGINQDCLDLRQPGKTGYLIGVEIEVEDLSAFEMNLLSQSISQAHCNTAFNLHFSALRIDGKAHVLSTNDPHHLDSSSVLVDFDFSDMSYICSCIDPAGDSVPAAAG